MISCDNRPVEFERVIVARTLITWLAADGSVAVQIANPSSESLALHAGLEIRKLSSVAVVSPAQLQVHAVAATPNTPTESAAARAEMIAPLSRAFVDSSSTVKQQSAILDLCAKYRPVDRPPYRPNPRTSEVIDKCVNEMLEWAVIEEQRTPWGSPCTIVAKSNGSPRFCVDYRHTLNRHIIRKRWPMPNLESCLDVVGDTILHSSRRHSQRVPAATRGRGS